MGLIMLNPCCGPKAERQQVFFSPSQAETIISQAQHGLNSVPNVQVYDSVGHMISVEVFVDTSTLDIRIRQESPFVAIYIVLN